MAREAYELVNIITSSEVVSSTTPKTYFVDQLKNNEVYDSIISDDYIIPLNTTIILRDDEGSTITKVGDGVSIWSECPDYNAPSGSSSITWAQVSGKPTTFAPIVGTTNVTALAGNTVIPSPATVTPLVNGTASIGTSPLYARQDHVHPLQTTVASLATGRTFSLTGGATGTSATFNGSANASIPVTLAEPTATVRGGVLKQPAIANLSGEDPIDITNFNQLLSALRLAGIITA